MQSRNIFHVLINKQDKTKNSDQIIILSYNLCCLKHIDNVIA